MSANQILRLLPYQYIHVEDKNENVTRLEIGPQIFVKKDNEALVFATPKDMFQLMPRTYMQVNNPIMKDKDGKIVKNSFGEVERDEGETEFRFFENYKTPFPLYPGEELNGKISDLEVIQENQAFRLRAMRKHTDNNGVERLEGSEWLQKGLSTYYPSNNVAKVDNVDPHVITLGSALEMRASRDLVDQNGNKRTAGENFMVKKTGTYLQGVYEEYKATHQAKLLTSSNAVSLRAKTSFTDCYDVKRNAGDAWLVTNKNSSMHFVDVYERFVADVKLTVLTMDEYVYVQNPYSETTKTNNFGTTEVRVGPKSFFLYPNESIIKQGSSDLRSIYVLTSRDAVLVKAVQKLGDKNPGDRWMVYGPQSYYPPVEVEVVREVQQLPLDKNEGIYVRNTKTGDCRAVIGENYMLKPDEERYSLHLPDITRDLLKKSATFDADKLITYNCPFNTCVQVFNY